MQSVVPDVMELDTESKQTHDLYGIGHEPTDNFGRQCLLARKFAEQGVATFKSQPTTRGIITNRSGKGAARKWPRWIGPSLACSHDLAQRGLLEDTLVLWGAEFGRTPFAENGDGRNHHPKAFTVWMAGGGTKGGMTHGATDDFGYAPVESPVHMHDLHATLLHLLGVDHERLTYRHAGRDFRRRMSTETSCTKSSLSWGSASSNLSPRQPR